MKPRVGWDFWSSSVIWSSRLSPLKSQSTTDIQQVYDTCHNSTSLIELPESITSLTKSPDSGFPSDLQPEIELQLQLQALKGGMSLKTKYKPEKSKLRLAQKEKSKKLITKSKKDQHNYIYIYFKMYRFVAEWIILWRRDRNFKYNLVGWK